MAKEHTIESDCNVTFSDGTIETYRIRASSSLIQHLAKQIGETGCLTLLLGGTCICIPAHNIRSFELVEVEETKESSK